MHATAWNNLGHFLRAQLQQYAQSVRALERAVLLAPAAPIHRFNLAESLRMNGDMAGALRNLEIAVAATDPPLSDAAALLVFYRRLISDWSTFEQDVGILQQLLAGQLLSGVPKRALGHTQKRPVLLQRRPTDTGAPQASKPPSLPCKSWSSPSPLTSTSSAPSPSQTGRFERLRPCASTWGLRRRTKRRGWGTGRVLGTEGWR